MRVYLEKRVVLGLIVALAVLAGLSVMTFTNNKELADGRLAVSHTNEVLYHSEQLLAAIVDAETGQRGYAITGNDIFLQPYHRSLSSVNNHFETLVKLTADNALQQARLSSLKKPIDQKILFTTENVNLRKEGIDAVKRKMETLEGKILMDTIRLGVAKFQADEKKLLEKRVANSDGDLLRYNIVYFSLIIVIFLVLVFVFILINTHLRARIQAETMLRKTTAESLDLYDNAPCGYHSLDSEGRFVSVNNTLLTWLHYTREEMMTQLTVRNIIGHESMKMFSESFPKFKKEGRLTNLEFEMIRKDGSAFPVIMNAVAIYDKQGNYLRSRTTVFDNTERREAEDKLKKANRELEAFTYTVSHDLRAPLRSINGYSAILEEEYSAAFDDEGQRLLGVIAKNARQMGRLIDDLLEYSRLGKKELEKSWVAMDDILRPVALHLSEEQQTHGRNVKIIIDLVENVKVDIKMMRQVWTNLISNALKYSAKRETTTLEIGSYPAPPETIFYIRDNGVGFDMQFVDKLFGVFQRLHKMQDFEGTGVGLAIVKRIIERHSGRVWAESVPGAGASFYFSIPQS